MIRSKKKKKKKKIVVSLVSSSSSDTEEEKKAPVKMPVQKTETRIVPSKPNKLRSDEGLISVEEYSTKILEEVGPKHWLMHLMKELDSAGPMSKHTNVAIEIIRNFPVIVFTSSGNKNGKKVIQLLEECRRRHNIHENAVLEIFIDDTRAGNKTYNDLVAVTKVPFFNAEEQLGLPQIFIDEVFYGGYEDIRALHKEKKLGRTMLAAVGFTNLPCKICKKKGINFHDHQYW